jgi:hypothetical protein
MIALHYFSNRIVSRLTDFRDVAQPAIDAGAMFSQGFFGKPIELARLSVTFNRCIELGRRRKPQTTREIAPVRAGAAARRLFRCPLSSYRHHPSPRNFAKAASTCCGVAKRPSAASRSPRSMPASSSAVGS